MSDTLSTSTVDHPMIEEDQPDVPGGGTAPQGATFDDDDADFAELPPKRRVSRITKVLLVGILVAAAFGGGVMIQKNFGASSTSSPSGLPTFAGRVPAGFQTGAGGGGGGAGNGGSGDGSTAASGPVVVGTVVSVSGNDVTVEDLGGAAHVIHVTATTGLATAGVDWSTSLRPGSTVSVNGTKADDGSVAASTNTHR
jgi:hypothetical protein